jgi:hypothetical protein
MISPERKPLSLARISAATSVSDEEAGLVASRDSRTSEPGLTTARRRAVGAWFTPRRFAVILLLLIFAAYPDVMLGSHTFFYRDYGCFGYPLAHFYRESFRGGEVPLWNPLNNCGIPFLAQWNTMVLYPLSTIYLLVPMPWALGFFCLGHLFLGGLGMFLLVRRWTDDGFAASFAGLAYALNGVMLHALMWPNNIAALGWMPFVVLLTERAWREGGRTVPLAAAVGATQMLSGAPEVILFTWVAVALVWLSSWRVGAGRWRSALRSAVTLGLVAVLVLGLAAAQLFPFLDLLTHSQRSQNFGGNVWSMPPWGLANFLVPLFGCTSSVMGVVSQDEQQWTSSYYVGAGVVALALFSALRWRHRLSVALALAAGGGLLLALGEQGIVLGWLRKLAPALGFVRFPIKFVILPIFALPLLAACALDWWQRMAGIALMKERRWLLGVGVAFLVFIAAATAWAGMGQEANEKRGLWIQNGVTRAVLFSLLLGCVLNLRRVIAPLLALLIRFGILGLLALDLLTHTPRQNPTVMTDAYRPDAVPHAWTLEPAMGRALVSARMQAFMDYAANPNAYNFCVGHRRALTPNWNLLEGVATVGGFYSLYTKEQYDIWSLFYRQTNFPARLADFLGVARASSDSELFAWVERTSARPLVTAGLQPVFADAPTMLDAIGSREFSPQRVVYLPESARGLVHVTEAAAARVLSIDWKPGELKLDIEAGQPAMVTVAQTHYHCWKASVNGVATRVWPANHAFQALEVPAGRSTVHLVYSDRSFFAGGLLSLATALVCTGLWLKMPARVQVAFETAVMP